MKPTYIYKAWRSYHKSIPVSYTHLDVYKRQALYNDMQWAPDLYLLYWYGLTEEQLPFLKNLAVQYAAFHTRSLGRFLYKRK